MAPCITMDIQQFSSSLSQQIHRVSHRKHHSKETKLTAIYFFRKGESISSICSKYKITRVTFYLWRKQWDDTKSVKPLSKTGRKQILNDDSNRKLVDFYKENPTATNEEGSAYLNFSTKPSTVSNYLKRANFTRKKVSDERILEET